MTEGNFVATRFGVVLLTLDVTVTDTRGKSFRLHGSPDVGGPWTAYAGNVTWNSMMKWTIGDRVGYGVVMDNSRLDDHVRKFGMWPQDGPRTLRA